MRRRPCALCIGGLDPGGGAGVIADLRAVSFANAFGGAVVAVSTVQSTSGMKSSRAMPARHVAAQALEVLRHQRVRAVKIGALGSADNVRAVASVLRRHSEVPVVVDTPMLPSRGKARLLDEKAVFVLRDLLLPRASLVTVNAPEAAALLGEPVRSVGAAHDAARRLVASLGAHAALVKGGHLGGPMATDVLAIGNEVIELRAKRIPGPGAHGTGCVLASLIAGHLATRAGQAVTRGDIVASVRWAKRVHHAALSRTVDVGGEARVLVF